MLQSMGSQRVRHDWVTEQQQDKSLFLSPETRDSQLEVGTVVPQPSGPQTLACSPLVLSLVLYGLR